MTEITGRLENWFFDPMWKTLVGDIYEDARCRFGDGERVRTSKVMHKAAEINAFKEGDTINTKNSVYLLGKKNEKHINSYLGEDYDD